MRQTSANSAGVGNRTDADLVWLSASLASEPDDKSGTVTTSASELGRATQA